MKVKFPVGDWGGDGHERCEYFTVKTGKDITLEDISKAHKKSKEVLGFPIGSICSEYEDRYLKEEHVLKLKELGYTEADYGDEPFQYNKSDWFMMAQDVAEIWVFFLNHINPRLKLKLVDDDAVRFLPGDVPGYGCFC